VPALTVGLTGGIGSGKSVVLAEFVALGAIGVDADDIAREVVAPGTRGFAAVLQAFDAFDVSDGAGGIDRRRLAAVVFADADARARLEAIVHPLVREETRHRIGQTAPDAIVINAVPLLVETGLAGEFDAVVVVCAPVEVRLQRLLDSRAMTRADGLARIAAQASDEERIAVASWVIDNDGTSDALRERVATVWTEIRARAAARGQTGPAIT
jgi:dephospho-CoA kinase